MIPRVRPSKPILAFVIGVMLSAGLSSLRASAQEAEPCTAPPAAAAPAATETPPPAASATPATAIARLRLNELLPNPVGDDAQEFIEVMNPDATDANLAGWSIVDGSGKRFSFGSGTLAAESGTYMLYAETNLRLANTAGHLELIAPDGSIADQISYSSPVPEGKSYSRFPEGWQWTSRITPGTENDREPVVVASSAPVPVTTPPATAEPVAPVVPAVIAPPIETPSPGYAESHIVFSATQPNPDGADDHEWFELRNDGGTQSSLDGWHVMDAGGGSYALTGPLDAGAVRRVEKTAFKFALNNDTEELRLLDPSGAQRDSVHYLNAPSGATYVLGASGWSWSTGASASSGGTLALSTEEDDAGSETSDPAVVQEERADGTAEIPLAEADALADGTDVLVHGIVTLPPGVIGKTTFAIRDADEEVGTYVRIYGRGTIPTLTAGTPISISGKIKKDDGLHINTNSKSITLDGPVVRLPAAERDVLRLDASDDGLAVTLSGLVAARGKRWITLSDDAASREVTARIMKGEAPAAKPGDTVTLTGTVRSKGDVLEIIVADAAMVTVTPAVQEATQKAEAPGAATDKEATHSMPRLAVPAGTPFAAGTAAALALAGAGAYLWWRSRREEWPQELAGNLEGEGLVDR